MEDTEPKEISLEVFQRYNAFMQNTDERMRFLREEVEAHARTVFDRVNLRRDGVLSVGELANALRAFNLDKVPELSEPDAFRAFVLSCFEAYEQPAGSGTLTFDAFTQLLAPLRDRYVKYMPEIKLRVEMNETGAAAAARASSREFDTLQIDQTAIARIFQLFDADRSGFLDAWEISNICREMGIADYERDEYKGLIIRSIKEFRGDNPDEDDGKLLEHEFNLTEFKNMLCMLVTCKVDRNYRKYILSKSIARGVLHEAKSPKDKGGALKKAATGKRSVLQKAGLAALG